MGHKVKQSLMSSRIDFFYYAFRNVLFISLPLVIISAVILSIPRSVAVDGSAVDRVVFALPSSCTLSSKIDAEHNATILNGIYKKDIGQTSLGTFCNDENGYIIYAIGATNGEEGNTVLASSVSLPNSSVGDSGNYDIATGLAESGDTSNWAMKLGYKTGDTSTTPPVIETNYENKYALIPNNWTKVVSKQAGTTDMDKGSNFTTTYAVYTSPTQPAGTYTGQVKFALFHPSSSAKPTTLAEAYKNAGKQKIEVTDPITGETGSFYKMQDMTTAICNAANVTGEASQTQLVDIRDNKLYWVTKLLDGHCWMTQNLDLDLNSEVALTSENTDLNLYGANGYDEYNGYSCSDESTTTSCIANGEIIIWLPERSTIVSNNLSSNTWTNDGYNPYSYDNGLSYPDTNVSEMSAGSHGLSGNYYNWSAAIASNNSSSYRTGNASNSICPKNWRLPDTTNFDFSNLLYTYGVTKDSRNTTGYATDGYSKITSEPLYLIKTGFIYNGSIVDRYSDGIYWSSSIFNSQIAFLLYRSIHTIEPASNTIFTHYGPSNRVYGATIRCIAK